MRSFFYFCVAQTPPKFDLLRRGWKGCIAAAHNAGTPAMKNVYKTCTGDIGMLIVLIVLVNTMQLAILVYTGITAGDCTDNFHAVTYAVDTHRDDVILLGNNSK